MGFLDRLMGTTSRPTHWNELHALTDLDKAIEESKEHPVVLFKHSVTCGISAGAHDRLEGLEADDRYRFYYLDLLAHRDISNEIARRFGIIHQSPQIIVLRNGKATFTTSHHAINAQVVLAQIS
jgi:bacillithiol system protein YtxJ